MLSEGFLPGIENENPLITEDRAWRIQNLLVAKFSVISERKEKELRTI